MLTVVVSFFGTIFLSTLTLLFLNYSVYLWENKKILDLSSRIKSPNIPESEMILGKSNSSRGFTSIDMGESLSKQRSISPINADERKVLFTEDDLGPKWINQIVTFFKRLRANFWIQLKNGIVYLINLAKNTQTKTKNADEEKIITEVIEKVKSIDDQEQTENENPTQSLVSPSNQVVVINPKKSQENENPSQKSKELFEKMEDKLLKKLKEVGMNHFDIWLDLGKLYEDQNEPKKAKEIYQMVLKHATGKDQEAARNALYRNS